MFSKLFEPLLTLFEPLVGPIPFSKLTRCMYSFLEVWSISNILLPPPWQIKLKTLIANYVDWNWHSRPNNFDKKSRDLRPNCSYSFPGFVMYLSISLQYGVWYILIHIDFFHFQPERWFQILNVLTQSRHISHGPLSSTVYFEMWKN